jgi:hypothetical protein
MSPSAAYETSLPGKSLEVNQGGNQGTNLRLIKRQPLWLFYFFLFMCSFQQQRK